MFDTLRVAFEPLRLAGAVQELHELAAEDQRQCGLVKQVVALEGDPALAVVGYNAAGHQAVQVKMALSVWSQVCRTAKNPSGRRAHFGQSAARFGRRRQTGR